MKLCAEVIVCVAVAWRDGRGFMYEMTEPLPETSCGRSDSLPVVLLFDV